VSATGLLDRRITAKMNRETVLVPSSESDGPTLAPLLVSAKQAAALCAISPATWWRWVSSGRVPAPVRPSAGVCRWRLEELQAWVAAGTPTRENWVAMQETETANRNGRLR
jgi:predicted DNA-binding transcriptional regulator AlpA